MTKRWTRRSALALLGSGAGLLVWGSGGFTDVFADRETNVDTTGDPGGLLGINTLDGTSVAVGDTEPVVELTNNTGDTLDTIDASVTNNPSVSFDVEIDDTPGSLDDGDTGDVIAKMNSCGNSSGEETVQLEITASSSNGSVSEIVAVRGVDLSCESMANLVQIDESAAWTFDTAKGQTGVAFDITNVSNSQNVVVTEVGVDSASAGNTTVEEVRNDSSPGEFGVLQKRKSNTDFSLVLLDLQGGSLAVQVDNTAGLDSSLTLQPGDSEPVGLNEFRDASDKTVNMNKSGGGNATVRLVFDDGSEDTYALQNLDNQPP